MLINFSVSNWACFKDKVSLSMLPANNIEEHKSHIIQFPQKELNLLPITAIYGGNGSGKSSLIKALNFLRNLVLRGVENEKEIINVAPFLLDELSKNTATTFEIEIFIQHTFYKLSVSLNSQAILEESLKINDRYIYKRNKDVINIISKAKKYDELKNRIGSTYDNELFIRCISRNKGKTLMPFILWFYNLTIISPDMTYSLRPGLLETELDILRLADTGIFNFEEVRIDPNKEILDIYRQKLENDLQNHDAICITDYITGDKVIVRKQKNYKLDFFDLKAVHQNNKQEEIHFNIGLESDGTRRLIDLLAVFGRDNKNRVFIIDELDRSLHAHLVRALVRQYLDINKNSQLIFTTHDVSLMTLNLFRKDEIWFTQRDSKTGNSELYSLNSFDSTYDTQIAKAYRQGLYGGVPDILLEL